MSTDKYGRLLRRLAAVILRGMLYAVGTHIDFKNRPPAEPVERLYDVGTQVLFVNWIPSLTILQVAV